MLSAAKDDAAPSSLILYSKVPVPPEAVQVKVTASFRPRGLFLSDANVTEIGAAGAAVPVHKAQEKLVPLS